MKKRDWFGMLLVAAALAAVLAFRAVYVEPRSWGAACATTAAGDWSGAPWICQPRAALLWLQNWQLWGLGALLLGLAGFVLSPRRASFPLAVAAVALGAVATANYNASWGMLGLALGAWSWLRRPSGRGVVPAGAA